MINQNFIEFIKSHGKALISHLTTYFHPCEIKAEGNGKKIEAKIKSPEDLDKVIQSIKSFIG